MLPEARAECGAWVRQQDDWLACQPQTYMNRSGSAVHCLCESHGLESPAVLVVYDDIHLPLGRLRLRAGGSAAGHRGLASIIEALQTEAVPRLRLGIGGPPAGLGPVGESGLSEYVLSAFFPEETAIVDEMIGRSAQAVIAWLRFGIDSAMNLANAPDLPEEAKSE